MRKILPYHTKFRTCSALAPVWTPPMNESAELTQGGPLVNSLFWCLITLVGSHIRRQQKSVVSSDVFPLRPFETYIRISESFWFLSLSSSCFLVSRISSLKVQIFLSEWEYCTCTLHICGDCPTSPIRLNVAYSFGWNGRKRKYVLTKDGGHITI